MERVLYFDCSAGISGDMTLGALVDLGVSFKTLEDELAKLRIGAFRLVRSKSTRGGIRGTRVRVETENDPGHRHLSDFRRILEKSRLDPEIRERAGELFRRVFEAEAKVHGKPVEKIHLHELGSLDTLVDVVGAIVGLGLLEVSSVESSPVNLGGGAVMTEHGRMTVPAAATALLLQGAPVFSEGDDFERTTPTGALLVTSFAERFGPWPRMHLERIGYGLGSKNPSQGRANALRLALGSLPERPKAGEEVLVVETTIDDMTAEQIGYLLERLFALEVLDAFVSPVQMKKQRPGVNVTVLAKPEEGSRVTELLFAESSTLGIRWHLAGREILERRIVTLRTLYGKVRVKLGLRNGEVLTAAPEYEDCRKLASSKRVALRDVQQAAVEAYRRESSKKTR